MRLSKRNLVLRVRSKRTLSDSNTSAISATATTFFIEQSSEYTLLLRTASIVDGAPTVDDGVTPG